MSNKKSNAIVVDTNVLIHDPESINVLREDGNILYISTVVLEELNNLKNSPDIGHDVRDVISRIEKCQIDKDETLIRHKPLTTPQWNSLKEISHLDPKNTDHQIVATALYIKKNNRNEFKNIKLVTKEPMVRILSRDLNLLVDDYFKDKIDDQLIKTIENKKLLRINVDWMRILPNLTFEATNEEIDLTYENQGVVCFSDFDGMSKHPICQNNQWSESFAAIRKGNIFKIICRDIDCFGIKPLTINGDGPNWEQYIAITQLLDPSIKLVFLKGGTGSGKTLLALASALQQSHLYRNIFITRPMIPLEDEDRMGFLPGNIQEKMGPWIRPIYRTLNFLGEETKSFDKIEKLKSTGKISVEPLDYIRGMTYVKDFIIVDESQNLTPHQVKSLITRNGELSKMVFTGDVGQIDRRKKLNSRNNGLIYASTRMINSPLVSSISFQKTVRSQLANLAEERL